MSDVCVKRRKCESHDFIKDKFPKVLLNGLLFQTKLKKYIGTPFKFNPVRVNVSFTVYIL